MEKIRIVTDAASDVSVEDESKYNIKVLPFKIAMGNETYVSGIDFDNEQFYNMLETYDEIPTTSQITPFEFEEFYEEQYKEGYTDIVLVLINSKGSATYNNSLMAKETFFEEHPECAGKINIHSFDGILYTGAYGYPVIEAAKMVANGDSIENILSYIEAELPKKMIYFGMYSLKYAGKSGRIPSAAAFVGEAIGLKPVMKIWDHEITTAGKARGDKKLMVTIVNMISEDMEPGTPYNIVYGNDIQVRDEIIEKLTEKIGYPPVGSFQIGAAVAINAGPKVVGAIFDAKQEII